MWKSPAGQPPSSVSHCVEIHGPLDETLFEAALRRAFGAGSATDWSLDVVDLGSVPDSRQAVEAWIQTGPSRPRDPEESPGLTQALFRASPDHYYWYRRAHRRRADGAGAHQVTARVAEVYSALAARQDPSAQGASPRRPEPEAAVPAAEQYAADRRFWLDKFADRPDPVSLAGRRAPASDTRLRHFLDLTAEDEAALRATAGRLGVDWPVLVLAATAVLMYRSTGAEDLVLGLPASGRTAPFAPGDGSDVLPLRLTVRHDLNLTDLIRRADEAVHAAWHHRLYHQDELRRDLGSAGEPMGPATPEVHVRTLDHELRFGTSPATLHPLDDGPLDDLHLVVHEGWPGHPMRLRVDANPALYTAEQVATHAARFVRVLHGLAADPGRRVGQVDLLDETERHQVLVEWSTGPSTGFPADATVHSLFEARAAGTPDAVAVAAGRTRLTYRELNARANRLAHRLVRLGIRREDRVAVLLERSPDVVVASLAVLKAGGAYVPIDPDQPARRSEFILRDTASVALLTDRAPDGIGFSTTAPVIRVDGEHHPADEPASDPGIPVHAQQLAYVMYTSGSTGVPKGVANTHRNVVHLAADRYWHGGHHERVLMHSPYAFDASTFEIWTPLLNGGRVVVAPAGRLGATELAATIAGQAVTGMFVSAGLFRVLAEERPECFVGVREIWAGGDVVSPQAMRRVLDACPGTVVANEYGPTETTVFSSVNPLRAGDPLPESLIPIGRPLWNTRVYVLDPGLRPVPAGVAGELYIAGAGLARGYLGRPGLTAQRFVADPFHGAGERMYRTGDVVRWDDAGRLEFLGRVDDQVKIRGFRVELGEIETVIARHPAVAQVAVVAREDRPGDRRLVAYVVPGVGEPSGEAVRAHVAAALPEYMVPQAVVVLDALPLTVNGKLDRRTLPAPDYTVSTGGREGATEREKALCALFAEVLGVRRVGVDDNFFDLGGHSLLATRLASRIRSALGLELAIRTLFEQPTAAGLAAVLEQGGEARPVPAVRERPDVVPLSPAQRRLWFLDQFEGPGATYHIPFAVRLTGRLDQRALRHALNDVLARHETLRTVFPVTDGQPRQKILDTDAAEVPLTVVTLDAGRRDGALAEAVTAAVTEPFDLSGHLPFRATLLTTGPAEQVLVIVVHHIAADGWSLTPLTRDISTAYAARCRGQAPAWVPLSVQYADYTLWQRDLLGDDGAPDSGLSRQLDYWRSALAGLPEELTLPADHPRPAVPSRRAGEVSLHIPAEVHRRLAALAQDHNATPFMVLHSALAVLLSRLGAGTDIPVGTPVAGRTDEALDELVGFFVNTLVLRTDLTGNPTFGELLHRVREQCLTALTHQDVPFEQLVETLSPTRSAARHPLFQVMLVLQNNAEAALDLPGVVGERLPDPLLPAKFDLDINLTERFTDTDTEPAGIDGTIGFSADLFEPDTAASLAERFVRVLSQVVAEPGRRVEDVEVMDGTERDRLLRDWGHGPVAELPGADTLHALLEARAARTPDAVAVVSGAAEVSYRELNARANRLAWALAERGVGAERVVGIRLERSLELVVAIVAVLKAGGAYLPLDPDLPAERVDLMVADADPLLVVDEEWLAAVDVAGLPHGNLPPVDAGCAAYVMFTSGSTGRPKGTVVAHRGVANWLWWLQEEFELHPEDRVLWKTPFGFDVSVRELFWPLMAGAAVVVARPGGHRDAAYLAEAIRSERVTVAHFVPSMLQAFLEEPTAGTCTGLRRVLCSGEALPVSTAERFDARFGIPLHNLYGPTEASVEVTHSRYEPGAESVPIGDPITNMRVYVLDAALRPVPAGVAGELYLAGVGLARGYVRRPGLTAERFVADPFSDAGERMYRTGDVVRWDSAGRVEFLGRSDDQVKIRGLRVELGEIETVITRHPGLAQAVVVAREDRPGDQRLVAYVTPAPRAEHVPDAAALRAHTAAALPEYMVPQAVVMLDALPLTANGKLDRRALPVPDFGAGAGRREATTEREKALCALFADVLGVERVGVDDNFFELGGHSLLAVTLVGRMREHGLPVGIRTLFASPTVARLAAEVGGTESAAPTSGIPEDAEAITPDLVPLAGITGDEIRRIVAQVPGGAPNVADIYPLAPLQEGILFHHLMEQDGGSDVYMLPTVLRCDSRARLDAFLSGLREVIGRHDSLRTALVWEGLRDPLQVVLRTAEPTVRQIETEAVGDDAVARLLSACDDAMDISRAPLLRVVTAAEPGGPGWLLVLQFHQLILDHTGFEVVLDEIRAFMAGTAHQLPEPLPFRDFVADSRQRMSGTEQERFFTELLGDVSGPTLPFGLSDVHGDGSGVTDATLSLDAVLAGRLREQARRAGVSPAIVFHVVWARVVAAASAREDVTFGTVLFGRMHAGAGADRIPGLFMNTLPVRVRLGGVGVLDAIRATQAQMAELLVHEHASLALAQRASGVTAGTPLFSSLLNYRHTSPAAQSPITGMAGVEVLHATERTNYPLTLSVDDLGTDFLLTLQSTAPVAPDTVAELVRTATEGVVTALETAPDTVLSEIEVAGADDAAPPPSARGPRDRPAAPASEARHVGSAGAPVTEWEKTLCGLFAEVLGVARVGVDDNFFDLGGHSLLATRLTSRIRGEQPDFTLRTLLENPTVAQLASRSANARSPRSGVTT